MPMTVGFHSKKEQMSGYYTQLQKKREIWNILMKSAKI